MKFLAELRIRARHILGPSLGATLIVYVTFHALQGERGLIAFWQLHGQVAHARFKSDRGTTFYISPIMSIAGVKIRGVRR